MRRRRPGSHEAAAACCTVTALGDTVADAQTAAYNLAKRVYWDGVTTAPPPTSAGGRSRGAQEGAGGNAERQTSGIH